jgi:hypothetical protein
VKGKKDYKNNNKKEEITWKVLISYCIVWMHEAGRGRQSIECGFGVVPAGNMIYSRSFNTG